MPKAAVTVEALRCHECGVLIDPVEGTYVRRRIKTAEEYGYLHGPVARYELANLCIACDAAMTEKWRAETELSGQNAQTLGRLALAFLVCGLLHVTAGWPIWISVVVTIGLLWKGILGRTLLGMFVMQSTLRPHLGEAATVAWMSPTMVVVIGVALATKYGRPVCPQSNLLRNESRVPRPWCATHTKGGGA